jgi:hypothetical protein
MFKVYTPDVSSDVRLGVSAPDQTQPWPSHGGTNEEKMLFREFFK